MNTIVEITSPGAEPVLNINTGALREPNERVAALRQQKAHNVRVAALRAEWGAPKRQALTAVRREGKWSEKLATIENKLATKPGSLLALTGHRGNGKTQMAVEAMRFITQRLKSARFITAVGFFIELKATYRKDAPKTEKTVMAEFVLPQLLVIDEVSKRSDSNWENDLLFELLNRRYNELKDTILISNQPREELDKFLGASIVSRMNETGGFLVCDWPTFRNA